MTIALCSCGGDDDNDEPAGYAPDAAGWSAANVLTAQETSSFAYFNTVATLDTSGTAVVSVDGLSPNLAMFQASAPSGTWSPLPALPLPPSTYGTSRFGHFLANDRVSVVFELAGSVTSTTPATLIEATYQNGWSTNTIATSPYTGGYMSIWHVVAGAAGQRAVIWSDFPPGPSSGPSLDQYFSAAPQGDINWDLASLLPQDADSTNYGARSFLESGAFLIVLPGNTPYGTNLYGHLYESGSWTTPSLLIPSVLPNKVGCAAIATLDTSQYALAWLEETPASGSPTNELQYTARFAVVDGTSPPTVIHDVFPTNSNPTFSASNQPACPKIHATANGELTFVWHRGTQVLARRFVNGSFAGDAVALPVPAATPEKLIGAFDELGNFRFVLSDNNQLVTSEYRVAQSTWSALTPIWVGFATIDERSLAVYARGDAVLTWMTAGGSSGARSQQVSLMARRFTR